jgi:hypothetical protein
VPDEPERHQHVYPLVSPAVLGVPVPRLPTHAHSRFLLHIFAASAALVANAAAQMTIENAFFIFPP